MDGDGVGWVSGYETAQKLDKSLSLSNPNAQDLRAIDAQVLIDAVTEDIADGFHHNRDGVVFPDNVGLAFTKGRYSKVPTLFGYNAHEGSLFYPTDQEPTVWMEGFPKDGTRAEKIAALSEHYPNNAEALVDLYGLDGDAQAVYDGGMAMMGDEIFGANIRLTTQINQEAGQEAWAYSFNRIPPSPRQTIGAYHAAELPFIFNTHEAILGLSDEDKILTDLMVDYWTNFAKFGNPNGVNLPDWPEYNGENWMAFNANIGEPSQAIKDHRKAKLDALTEGVLKKLSDLENWQLNQPDRLQTAPSSDGLGSQ